jgi:hypothetical protein
MFVIHPLLRFSFILSLLVAAYLYFFFLPIIETKIIFYCPFHMLTGLYCPGCGTLRGLHYLAHGNILNAINSNPLTFLSLPFLVYSFGIFFYREISGKELKNLFIKPFFIWLLLAIILIFWVLRNIPKYPFNILAPH